MLLLTPFISLAQEEEEEDPELKYPIGNSPDPTQSGKQSFDLGDPSNLNRTIVYDPVSGKYIFTETIGKSNLNFRNPSLMTLEEYLDYERQKSLQDNWKDKIKQQNEEAHSLIPPITIPSKAFSDFFGSNEITIRPQGSVDLSVGVNASRYDNPTLSVRQRKNVRLDFNQQIQLNLVGQIGTKIKLNTSYNTLAAFDFDNITKLSYNGNEDQILQKLDLGNVSLPLNTSLIQGSQTLFGVRSQMKFGRLTVDGIVASAKGKRQEINITGSSQVQQYEVSADNYEANRHYFLAHFFRDNYDAAMKELPIVRSEYNITKIEVWVTNKINHTENTRNLLAFTDLGESVSSNLEGGPQVVVEGGFADNKANNLYDWARAQPLIRGYHNSVTALAAQGATPGPFQQAVHYEKVENARRLAESEFTYNALLGFITVNTPLNNDEVLAVAFEYTLRGQTYQIGEFSTDGINGQDALFLKLLKPTITNPKKKIWDLMMKNVYSIGAYQLDQQGFRLDIYYNNPETSLPIQVLPYDGVKDQQLITLLEMDRINMNNQPFSDGLFDFAPMQFTGNRGENGGTVNPKNGRIYFSTVEPFGATLKAKLLAAGMPDPVANTIAFSELYDSTKTAAQQIPSKNRFKFKGEYKSSISSDIPLNALNVPQGAVTVTAGGVKLNEGSDFTVDYNLGRVKILNTGILESNIPIKISIESNSVFGMQAKSLVGTNLIYRFSEDFTVGGTWMRMMERPITPKVDIGSEPFKNNVIGLNMSIRKELPFLTKLVDLLPVISTKAKSTISFSGEVAHLIPGSPRAITNTGVSYIDDFEGSQSTIDLRQPGAWKLASIPQGQNDLFPEAANKDRTAGFKRSKLAWYTVDQLFYDNSSYTPQHIKEDPQMLADSRMRLVQQKEIFPNMNLAYGTFTHIPILDLAYYPKERGMYNYDTTNTVDAGGLFTNPENRWGGIMRSLTTTDFEQTNIEYIQIWMLDPFNDDQENVNPNTAHAGGDFYINLGNVSEDVLPDSRKSFENGIPADGVTGAVDFTDFGKISRQQVVVNAFDTDVNTRLNQDVGLDGLKSSEEADFFSNYVNWVQNSTLSPEAKARMIADPSNDDYNFYRDDRYDLAKSNILERYKKYNGTEGNSATPEMSSSINGDGYPTQATNLPDVEDLNNDNTLNETEAYFQYKISLRKQDLQVGKNNITSITEFVPTGGTKVERWIQFKIPVATPDKAVNGISDFRSIRFMRMFLKNFDEEVVVRFARLELIRGEWRRYREDLMTNGEGIVTDPDLTSFNTGVVSIEENEQREPVKYVIPDGISREIDPTQIQQRQLNEQSLSMEVCNLKDGDARAAYRNVMFDVRTYKKMKLFVHAEQLTKSEPLKDDDLTLFIRMGTDFKENYYEYEMPLKLTNWGATTSMEIWPELNNVEIIFDDLLEAKKKRNQALENPNSGVSNMVEYIMIDPQNSSRLIKVKGAPNLQGVRTMMIGIRNPRKSSGTPWEAGDDGLAKCAIIWVNELRLTDFQNEGGSAAVARMQIQAADFANVSMSGNYSGVNWGTIESRVQERQRNQQHGFDFNTNLQLGQFFGKKAKISLPFFYGYSLGVINPEYDPFNPDIKLSDYDSKERADKARAGQDFTERRSYNFTNVRKELGTNAKPHFYNLSNFVFNYSYSENYHRDFYVEQDLTRIWKGGFNYNYSFNVKPVEPFKKVKFMQKSKWWSIIRETNFYLAPKNLMFNNDLMRNYNERQVRNTVSEDYQIDPVYVKSFTWNRQYALGYDITKNLKLTFNATNRALFDENQGRIDRKLDPENYQQFKDTIWSQMRTLGQTTDYTHNYNFSYNLPFDKIPALDWVTSNVKYGGTYNWQRAPLGQNEYGNTIQNSRTVNATAQLNFTNLYNKVPYFKKVNNDGRMTVKNASQTTRKQAEGSAPPTSKADSKKRTYVPEKPVEEMNEKELRKYERKKRRFDRKEERRIRKEEREKKKVNPVGGFLARAAMTVRTVSGNYTMNDGTLLPGYSEKSSVLGFGNAFDSQMGAFIFGKQQYDIFGKDNGFRISELATDRDWLVKNSLLNRQHTTTHSQNITGRAMLEPLKDLNIEVSINRNYSMNSSEFYRWNDLSNQFENQSRMETGNLTYSTMSMRSAFQALGSNYSSDVFANMLNNRSEVSRLLGDRNPNSTGTTNNFANGYSGSQQDVVVGAFLTAYTNNDINGKNINPIKNVPLPNWTVNYNGLTKFPFMKKYVKNFVIRHGYSSTMNISGIRTDLKAMTDSDGNPAAVNDENNNFYATRTFDNVTLSERFSPLIGLDATWNVNGQGLITKFEIKKDRSATLAISNLQLTEVYGTEYIFGSGYKFAKVKMPFKLKNKKLENPLSIRFDLSIRENLTLIRKIVATDGTDTPDPAQATAGQKVLTIKSSADYNINQNVTVQLYYDQTLNQPTVVPPYTTGNINCGFRIRLNLAGL